MNCNKISTLLSDYLDGTLPPRQLGEVQLHLKSCSECQAEVDGLRNTVDALRGFENHRLSAEFDQRLFRRLDAEKAPRPASFWQRLLNPRPLKPARWVAATGALAALSIAGWQLIPGSTPSPAAGSYLTACLQADASQMTPAHIHTTAELIPNADLVNDTTE